MGEKRLEKKWKILLLDTKEGNPNHYILIAIEDALRNHPSVESVCSVGYSDALNTAIRAGCNLFFAFDGERLDRGLCQRLSVVCGRSVLWVTEDPYDTKANVKNAELFDIVFTNDSGSVASYKGHAYHLPFAAFPKFHFQDVPEREEDHYLFDVLFVGTAWPNRVELLKALIPGLKGSKFKLGLQFYSHLPEPDLGVPKSSFLWRIANSELARLVNRSRVVLTLSRDYSGSGENPVASTPGPRLFETALSGGFQMVDPLISVTSSYFHTGREIMGFKNSKDCLEKIMYFLDHPKERLEIAKAAQKRCLSEHLYQHRVDSILNIVGEYSFQSSNPQLKTIEIKKKTKRILYVAHNCVGVDPFGGVEVYVDLLTQNLPEAYESFLYYPDRKDSSGRGVFLFNVRTQVKSRHVFEEEYDASKLLDPEREHWFGKILHENRIDLVHIQHLTGHPLSLPLVARSMGIPVVMTVPDFFPVCHRANLTTASQQYCNIPQLPLATCDICLDKIYGAPFGSQSSRRSFVAAVLENLDAIIFLSQSEREIVESIYPFLKKDPKVLIEGFPVVDKPFFGEERESRQEVLKIAVPGNFKVTKGANALFQILKAMRKDNIEFHIYGADHFSSGSHFSDILPDLDGPNIRIHGPYSTDLLHEKLLQTDVSLLLSVWPETYVLTLSESWRAGVVPIVTDIGALGERVIHRVNGLKVPVNQPGSVVQLLRELIADRRELERMRQNIHKKLYCKMEDHIQVLTGLYTRLFEKYGVKSWNDAYFLEYPIPRKASASNIFRSHGSWVNISLYFPGSQKNPNTGLKRKFRNAKKFMDRHGFQALVKHSIRKLLYAEKR